MRLLASIGIVIVRNPRHGACLGMAGVGVGIGDFHRCGAWPASASAPAASIDAAPGQHRYRHRQEPSTDKLPVWSSKEIIELSVVWG
jgi:hypothetical protein